VVGRDFLGKLDVTLDFIATTTMNVCISEQTSERIANEKDFSQCLPSIEHEGSSSGSEGPALELRATTLSTTVSPTASKPASSLISATPGPSTCPGVFNPVSAASAFAALNPGWNLGNTLDATPDEGSWNNPLVQAVTFQEVQQKGFKSIRIPGERK